MLMICDYKLASGYGYYTTTNLYFRVVLCYIIMTNPHAILWVVTFYMIGRQHILKDLYCLLAVVQLWTQLVQVCEFFKSFIVPSCHNSSQYYRHPDKLRFKLLYNTTRSIGCWHIKNPCPFRKRWKGLLTVKCFFRWYENKLFRRKY